MASKAGVKPQTLRRQDQLLITNDGRKNSFDHHLAAPCSSSSTTYSCKSHNSQAFDKLNEMRRNRHLTDIVLVVGNQRINAHRVVLAACSSYFRQMFTSSDQFQQEIAILDMDENALLSLINFCYTSLIVIDGCNAQALMLAARRLQMLEIQDLCAGFLKQLCSQHQPKVMITTELHESLDTAELTKKSKLILQSQSPTFDKSQASHLSPVNTTTLRSDALSSLTSQPTNILQVNSTLSTKTTMAEMHDDSLLNSNNLPMQSLISQLTPTPQRDTISTDDKLLHVAIEPSTSSSISNRPQSTTLRHLANNISSNLLSTSPSTDNEAVSFVQCVRWSRTKTTPKASKYVAIRDRIGTKFESRNVRLSQSMTSRMKTCGADKIEKLIRKKFDTRMKDHRKRLLRQPPVLFRRRIVSKVKSTTEDVYKVEKIPSKSGTTLCYRINDDKCYTFYLRSKKNTFNPSHYVCLQCDKVRQHSFGGGISPKSIHVDGDLIVNGNPMLGHTAGCQPIRIVTRIVAADLSPSLDDYKHSHVTTDKFRSISTDDLNTSWLLTHLNARIFRFVALIAAKQHNSDSVVKRKPIFRSVNQRIALQPQAIFGFANQRVAAALPITTAGNAQPVSYSVIELRSQKGSNPIVLHRINADLCNTYCYSTAHAGKRYYACIQCRYAKKMVDANTPVKTIHSIDGVVVNGDPARGHSSYCRPERVTAAFGRECKRTASRELSAGRQDEASIISVHQ